MLALLGPSGCGKSTTLKMLAGIEDLSEGEIYFDGEPVSQLAPGTRNIAMVFEDYALYPRMTVRENIAFPLRVRGVSRAEASERIEQVLALLQLTKVADETWPLSGGAQQRRLSVDPYAISTPSVARCSRNIDCFQQYWTGVHGDRDPQDVRLFALNIDSAS